MIQSWAFERRRQRNDITSREVAAILCRPLVEADRSIQDVLAAFWREYRCPACGARAWCAHRDRKADLILLLKEAE
jgi:hypothetical protein